MADAKLRQRSVKCSRSGARWMTVLRSSWGRVQSASAIHRPTPRSAPIKSRSASMQCCGTPLADSDRVEWTVSAGTDVAWLERVVGAEVAQSIDLSEDHHSGPPAIGPQQLTGERIGRRGDRNASAVAQSDMTETSGVCAAQSRVPRSGSTSQVRSAEAGPAAPAFSPTEDFGPRSRARWTVIDTERRAREPYPRCESELVHPRS